MRLSKVLDNLITVEVIQSSSYLDNNNLREFRFDGDFKNVISILPLDSTGTVGEYIAFSSHKTAIFAGYLYTPYAKESHSLMIVRKSN